MELDLAPGKYVVAVSGGVDSVSLLHALQALPHVKLVVAHFDHGIREDSKQDRLLVQELSEKYRLPCVYDEGRLGPGASEATAREARYRFLRRAQKASGATAIITAHHHDDLLETAILNLLRGTGRRGLTSMKSVDGIIRPMLHLPKSHIKQYAADNQLTWREDSTNQEDRYLRNRIRNHLLAKAEASELQQLDEIIGRMRVVNDELDGLLINMLHVQPSLNEIDRSWFILLPHDAAKEVMAAWLRLRGVGSFDRRTLERVVPSAKTGRVGGKIPIKTGVSIEVKKDNLALVGLER